MFIGPLNLLNPLWLWAAVAAVAVPLAAHLLSRWGGRLATFPAIRFVQQASADCARWYRPRHWLLLLLRCLLLALIVAAFTRPVWHRQRPLTDPSQGVTAAIILDRSASMTRTQRGATLFDDARRRAIDALKSLDPQRDRATVILLDRSPRPLLPELSGSFQVLIQRLEQLQPTLHRGDLDAALRLAVVESQRGSADGGATGGAIHLELFSDMQATQWLEAIDRGSFGELGRLSMRLHQVGSDTDNVAVYEPTINPTQPIVGQTATVSVKLANFGAQDTSPRVALAFAGRRQSQMLRLAAGSTATVSFTITPQQIGAAHLQIELSGAAHQFDVDDQSGLAFTVAAARPVALFTDSDVEDSQTAAFYVSRALSPDAQTTDQTSGVALATHSSNQMQAVLTSPSKPTVAVIVEAGPLDRALLGALHGFMTGGGGVIWIIDSPTAAESLQRFIALDTQTALSPIGPSVGRSWLVGADLSLGEGRFDDPILQVFEGPSRSGLLTSRFHAVMPGGLTPTAEPLLSFADGSPALATQWIGGGRLAVFAASVSPSNSDLVKTAQFLPLMHQLVRGLTPGPRQVPNAHPGESPTIAVTGDWTAQSLAARDNQGRPINISVALQDEQQTLVQFNSLEQPGLYQITRSSDGAVVDGVYVELDPAESDLRAAEDDQLALAQTAPGAMTAIGDDREAAALRPQGVELWPYLMAAAVLLAVLESVALALMGGAGGAGPGAPTWRQEATYG